MHARLRRHLQRGVEMEVDGWGRRVWYSVGSLMEEQVGAGAVNMQEPADLYVYARMKRATA